jgi:DNA-binding Lrp family transcriptional regulator
MANESKAARWTFFTNHGHVLLCLARSPELRLRDVASEVGVTERAVQRIVADLEEAGYLTRRRAGRHNEYEINSDQPLRHSLEAHQSIGSLISLVRTRGSARTSRASDGALRERAAARRAPRRTPPTR